MFEIICISLIFAVTLALGVVLYIEDKKEREYHRNKNKSNDRNERK